MKRHRIEVEGLGLCVVDDGERDGEADGDTAASAILVLHGFTGDAESMASVADALREQARVLRLELVGHGGSDSPADEAAYTMAGCVRQIHAVKEALGLDRPHLLGYSMGGRAALAAAVARPDAFASLVLIGVSAGIADSGLRAERVRADRALADRIEREGLEAFVDAWMALPIFASQSSRLGAAALARARAQRLRGSVRGLAQSLRGMGSGAQPALHAALSALDLPVLLVVGDEDARFRTIAAELEVALPDARTVVLPEAGHAAHLEAPEAFREALVAFLESCSGQPSQPRVDAEPHRDATERGPS